MPGRVASASIKCRPLPIEEMIEPALEQEDIGNFVTAETSRAIIFITYYNLYKILPSCFSWLSRTIFLS
jgi:hypothetical protein